jgi:multiple sugar transport system substrate-binding protein
MKSSFKALLAGCMVAAAVTGITGCSKKSAKTESASANQATTLKVLFMKQAGYSESDVTAMTNDFEAQNPDIKIDLTFVAYEELKPKILTAAQTGGYDVVLGDCIWPPQFAKSGMVLDVTDRIKKLDISDIYEGALQSTKYEGKYYGLPWLNDVKYLFYNKAMLAKAGITTAPATWDQLLKDAEILKEKGIVEYPIAASWAQAEALLCDYTVIAGSFGGVFVDSSNNPTFDTPENKKALDFMYNSIKAGLTNPKSLEMIEDDVLSTFDSGNAAFALNWTYMLNESKDASKSQVAGDVAIACVPGTDKAASATVNGGMPLMITSGCQHPDDAWEYMVFVSSKDIQKKYCKDALPIWKSLYSDPEVIKTGGEDLVNASKKQYQYIVNRPQVPYYGELSSFMQPKIQEVLLGKEDSGKALEEIQNKALSLQKQ